MIALGAQLTALQVFDGYSYSNVSAKNANLDQWFYPFGANAREGSALLLGFDSPLAFTAQQVNLALIVETQGLAAEGQHCDIDLSAMPVPATLQWEYWDSKAWQSLSLDKDDTRALTRSGHVYFAGPGTDVKKSKLGSVTQPLYWLRCRLDVSTYERAPRLSMVLTNTVRALQVTTIHDEVLGGSNGRPNQTMQLASAPVVADDNPQTVIDADGDKITIPSLRLEIAEVADQFAVWEEVADFFASTPDELAFRAQLHHRRNPLRRWASRAHPLGEPGKSCRQHRRPPLPDWRRRGGHASARTRSPRCKPRCRWSRA